MQSLLVTFTFAAVCGLQSLLKSVLSLHFRGIWYHEEHRGGHPVSACHQHCSQRRQGLFHKFIFSQEIDTKFSFSSLRNQRNLRGGFKGWTNTFFIFFCLTSRIILSAGEFTVFFEEAQRPAQTHRLWLCQGNHLTQLFSYSLLHTVLCW